MENFQKDYPSFHEWTKALYAEDAMCKVIYENLRRELSFSNFGDIEKNELIGAFEKHLDSTKYQKRLPASQKFKEFCSNIINSYWSRSKPIIFTNMLSHIKTFASIWRTVRLHLGKAREDKQDFLDLLKGGKMDFKKCNIPLSKDGCFIWTTPREDIPWSGSASEENALAVRQKLGLAHFNNDDVFEFFINPAQKTVIVKPTVFHAKGYAYFCPSNDNVEHGYALDLESMETGVREECFSDVSYSGTDSYRYVGKLPSKCRNYTEQDWASLYKRLKDGNVF